MTATYLFFNYNCILLCEIRFSDRWEHCIAQIYYYGNLAVLHKSILINLRFTNQIKLKFLTKSCSVRTTF